ncbi:MAG: Sec-independent protein translocase subunit TatA [Gammaproteobacteria bacterium]
MLSVTQLLVILAIVLVLFGAKKLRNIGGDLGGAIKNFRHSVKEGEAQDDTNNVQNRVDQVDSGRVIEAEVVTKDRVNETKL